MLSTVRVVDPGIFISLIRGNRAANFLLLDLEEIEQAILATDKVWVIGVNVSVFDLD